MGILNEGREPEIPAAFSKNQVVTIFNLYHINPDERLATQEILL
jgi:hypothetical protein